MTVRVNYYQGQGNDYCVNEINERDAEREGWYWPRRVEIVNTQSGHTNNIGNPGRRGLPTYPAEIVRLNTWLTLGVSPRYTDVFPMNGPVSAKLESRQKVVIHGLTNFAEHNFTKAFTQALDFLARMYNESFARSANIDVILVNDFLETLNRRAGFPDDDLVRFFVSFVRQVLSGYDPSSGGDRKFGHGSSTLQLNVLRTIETIQKAVYRYLLQHPDRVYLLALAPFD